MGNAIPDADTYYSIITSQVFYGTDEIWINLNMQSAELCTYLTVESWKNVLLHTPTVSVGRS